MRFAVCLTMRDGDQQMTFVEGASDDAVRSYLLRGNPPEPYKGFESIDKIFEPEPFVPGDTPKWYEHG